MSIDKNMIRDFGAWMGFFQGLSLIFSGGHRSLLPVCRVDGLEK